MPELVTITDQDPQYAALAAQAQDASSGVRLVSERQLGGGVHAVVFSTGAKRRSNPAGEVLYEGKIKVGRRAYSGALRDYADWQEAWWREAIQNAVDAGATSVALEAVEEEQSVRISCTDDGSGMGMNILTTKFLVWSETGKAVAGKTIGGFGVAKALLVFPWLMWEIHTRDMLARRTDPDDPAVYEVLSAPFLQGTRLTVWMDKSECTSEHKANAFIAKCYLPHVKFTVNGVGIAAHTASGNLLESAETAVGVTLQVCHNPDISGMSYSVDVRIRGVYMFQVYSSAVRGRIVVEVDVAPGTRVEDVFVSSRDRFSDQTLQRKMSSLISTIASNLAGMLLQAQGIKSYRYAGAGLIMADAQEAIAAQAVASLPRLQPKQAARGVGNDVELARQQLPKQQKEAVSEEIRRAQDAMREERAARGAPLPVESAASTELIDLNLEQGFATNSDLETAVKLLAWMPDTLLFNGLGKPFEPYLKDFAPGTMHKLTRRLLRLWAEYCRFILIRLNRFVPFGIGFVFHDEVGGLCKTEADGTTFILFNPARMIDNQRYGQGLKVIPRYRLTDERSLQKMFATALHEMTHLLGFGDHGDGFCGALTDFTGEFFSSWPVCRKIQDGVSRAELELSKAVAAAKPKRAPRAAAPVSIEALVRIAQASSFGGDPNLVQLYAAWLAKMLEGGNLYYLQNELTAANPAYADDIERMSNYISEAAFNIEHAEEELKQHVLGGITAEQAKSVTRRNIVTSESYEFTQALVDYAWTLVDKGAKVEKVATPLDVLLQAMVDNAPRTVGNFKQFKYAWRAVEKLDIGASEYDVADVVENAMREKWPDDSEVNGYALGQAVWKMRDALARAQRYQDQGRDEIIDRLQWAEGIARGVAPAAADYLLSLVKPVKKPGKSAKDIALGTLIEALVQYERGTIEYVDEYTAAWRAFEQKAQVVASLYDARAEAQNALPDMSYSFVMGVAGHVYEVWSKMNEIRGLESRADIKAHFEAYGYNRDIADAISDYLLVEAPVAKKTRAAPRAESAIPSQKGAGRPPAILEGLSDAFKWAWRAYDSGNTESSSISSELQGFGVEYAEAAEIAKRVVSEHNIANDIGNRLYGGKTLEQTIKLARFDYQKYDAEYPGRIELLAKHAQKILRKSQEK